MCKVKDHHDYSKDAKMEMESNGSKWLTESAARVFVGVVTAFLITGIAFGVRVYAFMSAGDRFTPEMHQESVEKAWELAREEFMQKDVYALDRRYLDKRLDRIEAKLDEVLELHHD